MSPLDPRALCSSRHSTLRRESAVVPLPLHLINADGLRFPDHRLLLLDGSESTFPSWVSNTFVDKALFLKLTHLLNSLAILKLNSKELLETTDDGAFIK